MTAEREVGALDRAELLEAATDALLRLVPLRSWAEISLRDIADEADVAFSDLYALAPSKIALLGRLSQRFDDAALKTPVTPAEAVHDRLFEVVMSRIEVMEPHRAALTAIASAAGVISIAPHLPLTARALLEAAGVEATPPRMAGMTLVWLRIVQVWRDDEGALNRTMAEIDKRLRQLAARLAPIGQGF